jgi:flagellar protein FliS
VTTNVALSAYQKSQVETSTPHKLVAMLYEGAISRCHEAEQACARGDRPATHAALLKAQDMVAELMASLDMNAGGEVARLLFAQYEYIHTRLIEANIRQEALAVKEAAQLLRELADTWQQIGPRASASDQQEQALRANASLNLRS